MKHLLCLLAFLTTACASQSPMMKVAQNKTRSLASDTTGADNWITSVKIGPSVPTTDDTFQVDAGAEKAPGNGVTRVTGGEAVTLTFVDAKMKAIPNTFKGVRIMGYSKSGKGQVLIHSANTDPTQPAASFASLTTYNAILPGTKAENHNGNVSLSNGDFVVWQNDTGLKLNSLQFIIEGFGDDDASAIVQLLYTDSAEGAKIFIDRKILNWVPRSSGGGGAPGTGGGASSGHSHSEDDTGAFHHGTCVSHGAGGGCESWSNGDTCVSHGTGGGCESWSNGNTCVSHGTGTGCESWSNGDTCVSHGTGGGCESWSNGNTCVSHNTGGGCESWSDGNTCVSHNIDGSCNSWSK